MKKFATLILMVVLLPTSSVATCGDTIEQGWEKDTEALWHTGSGAHDGASTAIGATVLGWGVGLALAIGILAAILHQGKSESGHSHCGSN